MITPRLFERLPMISVHPDSATREDIAELAGELMETRRDLLASQEEVATLRTEREQYRVQVEERYGAVAQWQEQAEINRQAWLKVQAEVAALRQALQQALSTFRARPAEAGVLHYQAYHVNMLIEVIEALAAVLAAPAPQE